MNQTINAAAGRNAVFLDEMGVGALWRLRNNGAAAAEMPPQAPADAVLHGVAAVDAGAAALPPPQAEAVPILPATPAPTPTPVCAAPTGPAPAEPPPAARSAPGAAPDDASSAWFDDAPMPPPPAPVSADAIAAMDWDALKAAAAKCTRCDLHRGRKGVVFGRGERAADWLVLGSAPGRADEKEARPIAGDAGKLLDNMLLAIGLAPNVALNVASNPASKVYVTNLVKCRASDAAGADRAPTHEESAACRPYLERELALTGARIILTVGQAAAGGLLRTPAAARGSVRRFGAIPVVATYHPADLLSQADNKAKAWADLCLARRTHAEQD